MSCYQNISGRRLRNICDSMHWWHVLIYMGCWRYLSWINSQYIYIITYSSFYVNLISPTCTCNGTQAYQLCCEGTHWSALVGLTTVGNHANSKPITSSKCHSVPINVSSHIWSFLAHGRCQHMHEVNQPIIICVSGNLWHHIIIAKNQTNIELFIAWTLTLGPTWPWSNITHSMR